VKSELIPEEPDLKCEDSKAGDNGVDRCEGTDETSCPEHAWRRVSGRRIKGSWLKQGKVHFVP